MEGRGTRDSQQDGVENNGRQRNANCPVHKQTNKQHDPRLDDKRAQENCKQRHLYSLSGIVWDDGRWWWPQRRKGGIERRGWKEKQKSRNHNCLLLLLRVRPSFSERQMRRRAASKCGRRSSRAAASRTLRRKGRRGNCIDQDCNRGISFHEMIISRKLN